jgi:hypothetical protein
MKYKGQYSPSQILCPVSLNFVDINQVEKQLESNQFCQISLETKNHEVEISNEELDSILFSLELEYDGKVFNAVEFIMNYIRPKMQEKFLFNLKEFITHVGKTNSQKFKIILS